MARQGLCGQGTLARLLERTCSAFILRVGAGASLWFPELQGFAAENHRGRGGGQFLGSILTLLQMRKLRSKGKTGLPRKGGQSGTCDPGVFRWVFQMSCPGAAGRFECPPLLPPPMWGGERDHGTRGTHELCLYPFL